MKFKVLFILGILYSVNMLSQIDRAKVKCRIEKFGLDSLASNPRIQYCYDADSINPKVYFIGGHEIKIDSTKRDSLIVVRLKHKGEFIQDYRIQFLERWGLRNESVGLASRKNLSQIPTIPVDSILRISPYSSSIPYDVLLVPYTDYYHMEIVFDFPFYRESDPVIFNCCEKGKDYSKSKEVVCPYNQKRRKTKLYKKPNCIECKLAYRVHK